MALDREELNKRRRHKEQQRRQQQKMRRRFMQRCAIALVALVASGLGIYFLTHNSGGVPNGTMPPAVGTAVTEPPTEPKSPLDPKEPSVIHIAAVGDLNVTDKSVAAGFKDGKYDYTAAFMDVAPLLSDADLTVLNFEGNLCAEPYGSERVSAPLEMMQTLKNMGVDMIQMANSYSIRNGLSGLKQTLGNIRSAGMEPLGAFSSVEEFDQSKGYTIVEIKGVKIAFVAFTKGMDSLGMPSGSEKCVNLLYTDYATTYQKVDTEGITKIMRSAQSEKPDLTIAMLHWGSEFNDEISKTQKQITKLLEKEGADVILGTHPHMVQEIKYDEVTGQFLAYSLGDFFGDAAGNGSNYSIILDLEITKDHEAGTTKVTKYSYTPIYTLTEEEGGGQRRVVRIEQAMKAYEEGYLGKISAAAYESMKQCPALIEERIHPKTENKQS